MNRARHRRFWRWVDRNFAYLFSSVVFGFVLAFAYDKSGLEFAAKIAGGLLLIAAIFFTIYRYANWLKKEDDQ